MLSQYHLFTGNKQGTKFVPNTAFNFASIPDTAFKNASAQNTFVDFSSKAAAPISKPSNPYKVVFESVTAEKKKLRTTVTYNVTAPPGFTFVEVGMKNLTEYCKELSRREGHSVYIVSGTDERGFGLRSNQVGFHIRRLGNHFRNIVVERACRFLGYHNRGLRMLPSGQSSRQEQLRNFESVDDELAGLSNDQRNKRVGDAIRELFPLIPDRDVDMILARGFGENRNTVGNDAHMLLARRVQLAVIAHIRHAYTEYDNLLDQLNRDVEERRLIRRARDEARHLNRSEARRVAEKGCLEYILRWRGEDNTDDDELEEILQEVIVIDDDNAGRAESKKVDDQIDDSLSVELVTSTQLATDFDLAAASPPYYDAMEIQPASIESERGTGQADIDDQARIRRKWREAKAQSKTTCNTESLVIDLTKESNPPRFIHIGDDYFEMQAIEHASLVNHEHYEIAQVDSGAFKSADGSTFVDAIASKPAPKLRPQRTGMAFKSADGSKFFDANVSESGPKPRAQRIKDRDNPIVSHADSTTLTNLLGYPSSPGTPASWFTDITKEKSSHPLRPQITSLWHDSNKKTPSTNSTVAHAANTAGFFAVPEDDQASSIKFFDVNEKSQSWDPARPAFRSFREAALHQAEHDSGKVKVGTYTVESNTKGGGKRKRTSMPTQVPASTAQRRTGANMLDLPPRRKKLRRTGDPENGREAKPEVRFESRSQRIRPEEEVGMINDFVTSAYIVEAHGGPVFTMIE